MALAARLTAIERDSAAKHAAAAAALHAREVEETYQALVTWLKDEAEEAVPRYLLAEDMLSRTSHLYARLARHLDAMVARFLEQGIRICYGESTYAAYYFEWDRDE